MKEMMEINKKDRNKIFIIIDKRSPNENIIAEYYDQNIDKSHKFGYSYIELLRKYNLICPKNAQKYYVVQQINLPFDITSIINQYLHE